MYDRRDVVKLSGIAATGGIAGCLDSGEDRTPEPGEQGTGGAGGTGTPADAGYGWQDATWDAYWYSLYNMSTNIAMSGNGVQFPHNDAQNKAFNERFPAMLSAADQPGPPIKDPNLNMAPFTEGDPHFTQKPVLEGDDGRPDATTLKWDPAESSQVVSPSSLAWTHLKGVTWAKNFENHFEILPEDLAAEFRSMVLSTLAQIGVKAALIGGGPQGNGALTKGETMQLVSEFRPGPGAYADDTHFTPPEKGGYPDRTTRPHHHAAMLWFLSDLTSLATGGWFGYENPEPLVPSKKIQALTDGLASATMDAFAAKDVASMESTRSVGLLLGAVGYYGPQAGSEDARSAAADYANELAGVVEDNLAGNGMVENGAANQAATQGIVTQGLAWASQLDGIDHTDPAESTAGYMVDELWDDDAGTFASGADDDVYTITSRDAGDITGGLNAAENVLGMSALQSTFARFFDATFHTGKLQRAQRPPSQGDRDNEPPLPPKAGGEYGQAAVYNNAVEYDTGSGEWTVTDDGFRTADALYLANQDIWISQWAGDFFQGRGVPGQNDTPAA
jgi:hypothetical protein